MHDPDHDSSVTGDEGVTVGIIVDALSEKFGDDALAIARSQAANALNETSSIWLRVAARLSER